MSNRVHVRSAAQLLRPEFESVAQTKRPPLSSTPRPVVLLTTVPWRKLGNVCGVSDAVRRL